MSQQIFVRLFEPKTEKFKEHTRCTCQNIANPVWVTKARKMLVFDFCNEFDSITLLGVNCSRKNVSNELLKYFNRIEFYNSGE